jgi:hypothetical protein
MQVSNTQTNTQPGAGGKGGPARTIAIDQEAAKHFITASFASHVLIGFLLGLGVCRQYFRVRPDNPRPFVVGHPARLLASTTEV